MEDISKVFRLDEDEKKLLEALARAVAETMNPHPSQVGVYEFSRKATKKGTFTYRVGFEVEGEDWEFTIECREPLRKCHLSGYRNGRWVVECVEKCAGEYGEIFAKHLGKVLTNIKDQPYTG